MYKLYNSHFNILIAVGLVNQIGLGNDMPSYTMMYSLQDGCDLVLYTGIHGRLTDHKIYGSNSVFLTIDPKVASIRSENGRIYYILGLVRGQRLILDTQKKN